jgi:hypothetical protein
VNVKAIRAAIFIDAGSQLGDAHLVTEAVDLLREIDAPTLPQFAYNLANGLMYGHLRKADKQANK